MTEMGAEIGEFVTDTQARLGVALICLLVGGVAGPIGWVWIQVGGLLFAMALMLLGVVGIGTGLALSIAVFRHRGERFTLCEQGVVRSRGRRRTEWRWTDIAAVSIVDARSHPGTSGRLDTTLGRLIGGELACTVTPREGGRLRFDGFTANARSPAEEIRAAVEDGATPRRS
jgi:hypothetical protein